MPRIPSRLLLASATLSLGCLLLADVGAAATPVAAAPTSFGGQSDSTPGGARAAEASADSPTLRATSIVHAPDRASTEVLVHGLGSAGDARVHEGRSMTHSSHQPTGRFVRAGQTLTVGVPDGAPASDLVIGLDGTYAAFNGGTGTAYRYFPLAAGVTTVTAPIDGMVHLRSEAASGSATVRIAGGEAVPTFVTGTTSTSDFHAELEAHADAPMIEVVGDRIFGDFQPATRGAILGSDVAARVAEWDRVVAATNADYGLIDDLDGLSGKASHRLFIASPDSSGGYANASNGRICFQVSSGAAADLFDADASDLWGLWHEIGHTYQTPAYNLPGNGEVNVNISALAVQQSGGFGNRLDHQRDGVDEFFATPLDDRNYASQGVWVRLLMFDQLRRAFGDSFYPRLNQEFRVAAATHDPDLAASAGDRTQAFALLAARIADRDLTPFFAQWGIPLSEATRGALAERPTLAEPIWQNLVTSDPVVERELAPYAVPTGTLSSPTRPLVIGQAALKPWPSVTTTGNSDGVGTVTAGARIVDAQQVGAGRIAQVLDNERGIRDVLERPATVEHGDDIEIVGLGDYTLATAALDPTTGTLRIRPTGHAAHAYFPDVEYFGIELRDPDQSETILSYSVLGSESASSVMPDIDREAVDGHVLVVRHREAPSRLRTWSDGIRQSPASGTETFRIVDGRFVRISSYTAGSIVAPTGETAELSDTTTVHAGIEFTAETTSTRGTVTFIAPDETVFADRQPSITAERRGDDDTTWTAAPGAVLSHGERSADGRRYTYEVRLVADDDAPLGDGTALRFPIDVEAQAEPSGSSELSARFVGSTNLGPVDATAVTPTAPRAEAPVAITGPTGGYVPLVETTVSGTADPGASVTVTTQWGNELRTVTADAAGSWSFDRIYGPAAVYTLTARQVTVKGTVGTSEPMTMNPIDAFAPLTVTSHVGGGTYVPGPNRWTGTATPGAYVTAVNQWGVTMFTTRAHLQKGTWSVDRPIGPDARYLITFTQTAATGETSSLRGFELHPELRPLTVTSHTSGGTYVPGHTLWTGTGHPDAWLVATNQWGTRMFSVRVAADGTWSASRAVGPDAHYEIRFDQTTRGGFQTSLTGFVLDPAR